MESRGDDPQRLGDVGGDGPPINRLGEKSPGGRTARVGDAGGDGPPINRLRGKSAGGTEAGDDEPSISRLAAPSRTEMSGTGTTARLGDAGGDGPPINPVPPRGYTFSKIKLRVVALGAIAIGLVLGLTGSVTGFLVATGIGLALDLVDFILGLRLVAANTAANAREKRGQR